MLGRKRRRPVAIQTLIGEGTRVEGDLCFTGGAHIDGVVNGGVTSGRDRNAFLSISGKGCVEGNIRVPHLALSGTVKGDVFVGDKAEFGPTAKVIGNVHYQLIEIAAGAEINGKLIHEAPKDQPLPERDSEPEVTDPKVKPILRSATVSRVDRKDIGQDRRSKE